MKTTSFFLRASMVAGLALAPLLMTSEVSAAPAQASCFDAKMTYLTDCGEAEIGANLAVKDDAIRITVTGIGAGGAGMPTVAEMVVSGANVDAESGDLPDLGEGYASWATRNGVVVSRCSFDPPAKDREVGAEAVCDLPLLGQQAGDHTIWFVGFYLSVPAPTDQIGTVPAKLGIVPTGTSRSVEFSLSADEVQVSDASVTDPNAPLVDVVGEGNVGSNVSGSTATQSGADGTKGSAGSDDSSNSGLLAGVGVAALAAGGLAIAMKKKKDGPAPSA